jgi:hypothetical protein
MELNPTYNCLECNDSRHKTIFIFNKEVFEKLADGNESIISMGNFQDRHRKTLSSGEVFFDRVYVINNLHHFNNLYKLTDGKITESKAVFVYAEPCDCMTKAFLRHESSQKEDKPRKKKRFE